MARRGVDRPILAFNVMFHPPDKGANASGCYALDSWLDPLTMMLGEKLPCHEDHLMSGPLHVSVTWCV